MILLLRTLDLCKVHLSEQKTNKWAGSGHSSDNFVIALKHWSEVKVERSVKHPSQIWWVCWACVGEQLQSIICLLEKLVSVFCAVLYGVYNILDSVADNLDEMLASATGHLLTNGP